MIQILALILALIGLVYPKVVITEWKGPITPVTADFIDRTLKEALDLRANVYILKLDTPGGLLESTRRIVQSFNSSPIPVVVFVYPPGSRAASAGAVITISADIAVMAPGTNIGAAHPVRLGQEQTKKEKDVAMEKALQDMLAFVRSIAQQKGRNVKVVEKMVSESLSLSSEEALKQGVIDFIAKDVEDLLKKLEGRKVKKGNFEVVLKTEKVDRIELKENLKEAFLKIITNPTVAYFLLMIGFYGILFELYNPGAVVPAVIGGISLLLGLYGLSVISVSWLGVLLIGLGVILLLLETVTPTFGALAVGGLISIGLGSFILIDPSSPYGRLPLEAIASVLVFSLFFAFIAGKLGLKAQRRRKLTGAEGMIGEEGTVLEDFKDKKGKVLVHGEIWNAFSDEDLKKGQEVIVEEVKGLQLKVKRKSSSS